MFSGCVKNMFGVVSGVSKVHSHIRFPTPDLFAQGLLDIYMTAKPTLNIMDAVVAMEGDGPTNGTPKQVGLILASPDGVALDVVASGIIGIDPSSLATTAVAARRGVGVAGPGADRRQRTFNGRSSGSRFRLPEELERHNLEIRQDQVHAIYRISQAESRTQNLQEVPAMHQGLPCKCHENGKRKSAYRSRKVHQMLLLPGALPL